MCIEILDTKNQLPRLPGSDKHFIKEVFLRSEVGFILRIPNAGDKVTVFMNNTKIETLK